MTLTYSTCEIDFTTQDEVAEISGVIASSLSVAAIFNNVVDCFGYVKPGRNSESDY